MHVLFVVKMPIIISSHGNKLCRHGTPESYRGAVCREVDTSKIVSLTFDGASQSIIYANEAGDIHMYSTRDLGITRLRRTHGRITGKALSTCI